MVKIAVGISPLFFFACKHSQSMITTKIDSVVTYHDTIIQIAERCDTFYLPAIIEHDTLIINKSKSQLAIHKKENELIVICKENEYKLKLDSVIQLKQIKVVTRETIVNHECKSDWHSFLKIFFWIVIALIVIRMLISKLMP